MTARQIIQLTAASDEDPAGYALCDDGSVWVLQRPVSYWTRVTEIPQISIDKRTP
jgi:hypothetical protein